MFFHGLILAHVPRPGPISTHGSTGWPLGHDVPWRIHWWSHRPGLLLKQRLCTVLVPIFSRHVQPWIAGYVPGFGFSSAGDINGKYSHTMVASNGLGPAQPKDLMIHLSYSHWFRILIVFIDKLPGLARQSCEPWKVMPYWFWSVKKLFESAALRDGMKSSRERWAKACRIWIWWHFAVTNAWLSEDVSCERIWTHVVAPVYPRRLWFMSWLIWSIEHW